MKPLSHAVIFTGVLNAANFFPKPVGVGILMHLIQPAAFTIVAASTAAALHDRRAGVLLILALIVLVGSPADMNALARFLIPLGLGIITGSLVRRLVMEELPPSTV